VENIVDDLTLYTGDLTDAYFLKTTLAQAKADILYNVAFPGGHADEETKRIEMLTTGLLGTHHLLYAARDNGVERFVQIGSSTEYGSRDTAHQEIDPVAPISIRGVSKVASTLICQQFAREFDFPVSILRLYAVYGPLEQFKRLVPRLCHAALTGETISLTPPGIVHDWVYVNDVVNACIKAVEAEAGPGEIFNIGSGIQTANETIVRHIEEIAGIKFNINEKPFAPRKFDTGQWQADISKAGQMLGWHPATSLHEGLASTFEFWQDHFKIHGDF
jgi:nucleoside-diphosphate-sugar epimerase